MMDGLKRMLVAAAMVALAACADDSPTDDAGDGADTLAAEPAGFVALRDVALRIAPEDGAASVTVAGGGTRLSRVGDTLPSGPGGERWLKLATWDDRRGWVSASDVLEADLWSHYQTVLGGTGPTALRVAYPIEGRWAVEAPPYSAGITPISTLWLLGDSARAVKVTAIDTVADCGGRRHRVAVLAEDAGGSGPNLERAALAFPASRPPTARRVAIVPVPTPEPDLAAAIARGVGRLRGSSPANQQTWLYSIGAETRWVALRWPGTGDSVKGAAAALILDRSGDSWSAVVAVPPMVSSAAPNRAALVPLAAFATMEGRPTLLLVSVLDYESARVDILLADAEGYRILRAGYVWGC